MFWRNEWVYSLPTKVPDHYQTVLPGSIVDLGGRFKQGDKPLFLHFFNPDCPCSRFNVPQFKSLVKQYGKDVNFGIVVMTTKNYTAREIQDKFDLQVPVSFDTSLAVSCGVYSTPQAVIINDDRKLYYRGNYNKSRYCTDQRSNYAQQALDSLLHRRAHMIFDHYALTAYGCGLPGCRQ